MSEATSVHDATEKAARLKAQAEKKLEKKMTEQSDLEKTHIANAKRLKEEYERRVHMGQKAYEKEKLKIDEEVEQEKTKLEKPRKKRKQWYPKQREP